VLAGGGEFAAHGGPVRQLDQGEPDTEPVAERTELGERRLKVGIRVPAVLASQRLCLASAFRRRRPRVRVNLPSRPAVCKGEELTFSPCSP